MSQQITKTIKFRKEPHPKGALGYEIVTDAYILGVITALSDEYDFSIKKVTLKDWLSTCSIKIQCDRNKWYIILNAFAAAMGGYIKEITG